MATPRGSSPQSGLKGECSQKHQRSKPWLFEWRSSDWFVITTVCVALFSIIPIVPEALIDRAGVAPKNVQKWISLLLAAYGVTVLAGSPILGYFSDRYGTRKTPFAIGLIAMVASTALFVVGLSPYILLFARALQGFSAAVVGVIGLTMMVESVDKEKVGQAMGYSNASTTPAMILGPALGGVIYKVTNYYTAFAIPVVLLVLDILFRLLMLDKKDVTYYSSNGTHEQPVENTANYATFSFPGKQVNGSNSTSRPPSPSPRDSPSDTPLIQSAPSSDMSESSVHDPLMMFRLLSEPRLLVALQAVFATATVITALETTLPLFVMRTFGWDAGGAGLTFLAIYIPCLIGPAIGKLVDRAGPRVPTTVAGVLMGTTLILLRLVENDSRRDMSILLVLLVLIGFAVTTVNLTAMSDVGNAIRDMEQRGHGTISAEKAMGQGYGLMNVAFAGAQLIGPILAGFVADRLGWKSMTLVLGLLYLLNVIPMMFFIGGRLLEKMGGSV